MTVAPGFHLKFEDKKIHFRTSKTVPPQKPKQTEELKKNHERKILQKEMIKLKK